MPKFLWRTWFEEYPDEGCLVVEAGTKEEAITKGRGEDDEESPVEAVPLTLADFNRMVLEEAEEELRDALSVVRARRQPEPDGLSCSLCGVRPSGNTDTCVPCMEQVQRLEQVQRNAAAED